MVENALPKTKCAYADKYKSVRKPTCGCKACNEKWGKTHNPTHKNGGVER